MTAGYKAAGNDMVSYHVWQQAANRPWDQIMNHASPVQLASLGIPYRATDSGQIVRSNNAAPVAQLGYA